VRRPKQPVSLQPLSLLPCNPVPLIQCSGVSGSLGDEIAGGDCVGLLVRRVRCSGSEFLEARIIPKRIDDIRLEKGGQSASSVPGPSRFPNKAFATRSLPGNGGNSRITRCNKFLTRILRRATPPRIEFHSSTRPVLASALFRPFPVSLWDAR